MDSRKNLTGPKFSMEDGTTMMCEVIYDSSGTTMMSEMIYNSSDTRTLSMRKSYCFGLISQHMSEHGDMIVGLDIKWSSHSCVRQLTPYCNSDIVVVALLILCTKIGCVLLQITQNYCSIVQQFFDNKEIIFVGVHIKDDIVNLGKLCGLEIKNAVDLSELAAEVLNQPRLRAFGVRRLASEVLFEPFRTRSTSMDRVNWVAQDLTNDQIKCATTEAYAAYRTGKKLLGV